MRQLYLLSLVILVALNGCRPSLRIPEPDPGILQLDRFMALGDGYTAGLSNAEPRDSSFQWTGWHAEAQKHSFPQLMATQFHIEEDYSFFQPLLSKNGSGYRYIESMIEPICSLEPSRPVIRFAPADPDWSETPTNGAIHNLGLPGLQADQLTQPLGPGINPAWPVIGGLNSQSYLGLAQSREPGFFSIFLGLQQFVQFALEGGEGTPLPDSERFISQLASLIDICTATPGSQGLVANLPDPGNFPYFQHVGNQFINIENCSGTYQALYITTTDGKVQRARGSDRVLLSAEPFIGTDYNGATGPFGLSPSNPIPSDWVLDEEEHAHLRESIIGVNKKIDSLVEQSNTTLGGERIATVNLFAEFEALEEDLLENGLVVNNDYLSGGIFSLDGIYFTPRGNAWLANLFIDTINRVSAYGASIPPIDINAYPGVKYP